MYIVTLELATAFLGPFFPSEFWSTRPWRGLIYNDTCFYCEKISTYRFKHSCSRCITHMKTKYLFINKMVCIFRHIGVCNSLLKVFRGYFTKCFHSCQYDRIIQRKSEGGYLGGMQEQFSISISGCLHKAEVLTTMN